MYDRNDYIIKQYNWGKVKQSRIICDFCGEKQGYGALQNVKKNRCVKCQAKRNSIIQSKPKVKITCEVCGVEKLIFESTFKKSKTHTCSTECAGILRRKDIMEINRCNLKSKLLQLGVEPECANCGHNHLWNLQVHHIVFVKNGGLNVPENLQFFCRNCHADIHYEKGVDITE